MAKAQPKITLSPSRDIPFDKLLLSQANVRRVKNGVTIEDLADDIERRGLLHGINVRPQLDDAGAETGMFEVPAGGRRFRALEILVKRKRLARTALVPCVVKSVDDPVAAEEDSLAENTFREPLHPLDEFRGMQRLVEKGEAEEAIAAHFRVTPAVVRQRLKLAAVSPTLHEVYATGDMTLDQLMAFSVSDDHVRQEQVWEILAHSHNQSPGFIRARLTESTVPASDPRARFVGIDAYVQAGGCVLRDLFEDDRGGWLQDAALLDKLASEKLRLESATVAGEGWKWVEAVVDLPYGFDFDLRAVELTHIPPTEDDLAEVAKLQAEADALEEQWSNADEIPDEVDARVTAIDEAIAILTDGRWVYDPSDVAMAGAFVTIDVDGSVLIERGYIRAEDEPQPEIDPDQDGDEARGGDPDVLTGEDRPEATASAFGSGGATPASVDDEEDVIKPLPDRLVSELTAERTLALQDAFAQNPSVAFSAVLHNFVLAMFYYGRSESCLMLSLTRTSFPFQATGLKNGVSAKAIEARHAQWKARLPENDADLWDALLAMDGAERATLFAHCAAYGVNAIFEVAPKYDNGRVSAHTVSRRIAHSDVLARAVGLDMVGAGWKPTVDNYFGKVTKARILEAVADGRGEQAAATIDHLKKTDMALEAEKMMAETHWLPEPLRTPVAAPTGGAEASEETGAAGADDEDDPAVAGEGSEPLAIAAE